MKGYHQKALPRPLPAGRPTMQKSPSRLPHQLAPQLGWVFFLPSPLSRGPQWSPNGFHSGHHLVPIQFLPKDHLVPKGFSACRDRLPPKSVTPGPLRAGRPTMQKVPSHLPPQLAPQRWWVLFLPLRPLNMVADGFSPEDHSLPNGFSSRGQMAARESHSGPDRPSLHSVANAFPIGGPSPGVSPTGSPPSALDVPRVTPWNGELWRPCPL